MNTCFSIPGLFLPPLLFICISYPIFQSLTRCGRGSIKRLFVRSRGSRRSRQSRLFETVQLDGEVRSPQRPVDVTRLHEQLSWRRRDDVTRRQIVFCRWIWRCDVFRCCRSVRRRQGRMECCRQSDAPQSWRMRRRCEIELGGWVVFGFILGKFSYYFNRWIMIIFSYVLWVDNCCVGQPTCCIVYSIFHT